MFLEAETRVALIFFFVIYQDKQKEKEKMKNSLI